MQFALTTRFNTLSRMGEGRVWDLGARRYFLSAVPQNFDAWRQKPAPGAKVPHPRPLPSGRGCQSLRECVAVPSEKIDSLSFTGEGVHGRFMMQIKPPSHPPPPIFGAGRRIPRTSRLAIARA